MSTHQTYNALYKQQVTVPISCICSRVADSHPRPKAGLKVESRGFAGVKAAERNRSHTAGAVLSRGPWRLNMQKPFLLDKLHSHSRFPFVFEVVMVVGKAPGLGDKYISQSVEFGWQRDRVSLAWLPGRIH